MGEAMEQNLKTNYLARARVITLPAAAPAAARAILTPLDFSAIRLKIATRCFGGMPSFNA